MAEQITPDQVPRDDKDWTWTVERLCPDCGYAAGAVTGPQIATWVERLTVPWADLLVAGDARTRPAATTWSPLEYAAHVRDMCGVFTERVQLMLAQDAPEFADWDQNQAAIDGDYGAEDPARVSEQLTEAARRLAAAYRDVPADGWQRTGLRSNGSQFTVLTLGQYALHDLAHHLLDVGAEVPGTV